LTYCGTRNNPFYYWQRLRELPEEETQELYKPITAKPGYFISGKFSIAAHHSFQRPCQCSAKIGAATVG
jgi:hypothetical protein